MKRNETVFIGLEGGGTHSFAIAVDSAGRMLAMAESGSLNFFGTSLREARRHLERLNRSLQRQLPPKSRIAGIVVGCSALFFDATNEEKKNLCDGILPLERTRIVSDCQTACFGATLGRAGVVIVAGTGSIVVAQKEDGLQRRVGGWGHILGDEGSAYWMAVESVKAAIAAEERTGPRTELGRWVRQWFRVQDLTEVVPIIHGPDFTKERFAMLAKHLARKIRGRDTVFCGICRCGAKQLASQALAAVKLSRVKMRPLPVFLLGGVLTNNDLVRARLVTELKNSRAVRIAKPCLSPLLGAAALALVDARIELTAEVVANLANSDLVAIPERSGKIQPRPPASQLRGRLIRGRRSW
jgi:N-acetylglucosamine kinase-like BadF-type ATPase